jgi:hypothetical protein
VCIITLFVLLLIIHYTHNIFLGGYRASIIIILIHFGHLQKLIIDSLITGHLASYQIFSTISKATENISTHVNVHLPELCFLISNRSAITESKNKEAFLGLVKWLKW